VFVGGKLLQPGESREFNLGDLPPECAPPVADAPADKTAAELQAERFGMILAGNVGGVVADLPALDKAELAELQALEQAGAARKGVLQAIDAALLALASAVVPQ
jgi:acetylglutamate kinase